MVPREAENAGRCTVRPRLVSRGLSASLTSEGQVQSQASEGEICERQNGTEASSSMSASVLPSQRHSVQWFIPVSIHLPATVPNLCDGRHSAFALMVWLLLNPLALELDI